MKKPRKHKNSNFRSIIRKHSLIATVLVLILIVTTAILGQKGSKRKRPQSTDIVAASLQANKPSKEYIYAGSKLVATEESSASANGDDAAYVSGSGPNGTMIINGWYRASITMKNTGSTNWPSGFSIVPQNPPGNGWGNSVGRAVLGTTISPGSNYTFTFYVQAPSTAGSYDFQWRMQGPAGPFGQLTTKFTINVIANWELVTDPYNAVMMSQSVPPLMCPSQTSNVSIAIKNIGTSTWTTSENYKLGSQNAEDNTTWGLSRVALPASVAPGSDAVFNFNITAPTTPGTYNFQWMMLQEGGAGWFGTSTEPVTVTVADTQAPTITCPGPVTAVTIPTCSPSSIALVNFPLPNASDNCSSPTVTCSPSSGSTFPVGTTTVTCTATDLANNSAQCSFTVTVFNACIQNDTNPGQVILFNTFTGDYRVCCGGMKITGRGTVTQQGCIFTLQHNPADRRVFARVDFSAKTATGSLQLPVGTTRCTITDSDVRNNTCNCSEP